VQRDERAAEFRVMTDELDAIPLEWVSAGARSSELLPLADDLTDSRSQPLDVGLVHTPRVPPEAVDRMWKGGGILRKERGYFPPDGCGRRLACG
jgi:hypothetical protein